MNCQLQKPAKKERKEAAAAAAASSSKESKKKGRDGQDDGKKKKRKKKDPNAPKRAMTGFFYFSQAEREVGLFVYTHIYNEEVAQPMNQNELLSFLLFIVY